MRTWVRLSVCGLGGGGEGGVWFGLVEGEGGGVSDRLG